MSTAASVTVTLKKIQIPISVPITAAFAMKGLSTKMTKKQINVSEITAIKSHVPMELVKMAPPTTNATATPALNQESC